MDQTRDQKRGENLRHGCLTYFHGEEPEQVGSVMILGTGTGSNAAFAITMTIIESDNYRARA